MKKYIEIEEEDWKQNLLFKEIIDLNSVINHYTKKRDMNKIQILSITLKNKMRIYDNLYPNNKNIPIITPNN